MNVGAGLVVCGTAAVLAIGGTGAVALAASAHGSASRRPASAPTGYCTVGDYSARSRLVTATPTAWVTQRSSYTTRVPRSTLVRRTATAVQVVTASVRLDQGVDDAVANDVLGMASSRIGVPLASVHRRTPGARVTEDGSSYARRSTVVFFRGYSGARGTWQRSYCSRIAGTVGDIAWTTGTWSSFGQSSEGAVLCGAGTQNVDAVGRLAYRQGC